jgi:hypothetical protein
MIHFLLLGKFLIFNNLIQQYYHDLRYKLLANQTIDSSYSLLLYGSRDQTTSDEYFKYISTEEIRVCSLLTHAIENEVNLAYPSNHDDISNNGLSCLYIDLASRKLTIAADHYGSNPIWFAFEQDNFIITTDIVMLNLLNFHYPTPNIGESMISIDMDTKALNISRPQFKVPKPSLDDLTKAINNFMTIESRGNGSLPVYFDHIERNPASELIACFFNQSDNLRLLHAEDFTHHNYSLPNWYRNIMEFIRANDASYLYMQPHR